MRGKRAGPQQRRAARQAAHSYGGAGQGRAGRSVSAPTRPAHTRSRPLPPTEKNSDRFSSARPMPMNSLERSCGPPPPAASCFASCSDPSTCAQSRGAGLRRGMCGWAHRPRRAAGTRGQLVQRTQAHRAAGESVAADARELQADRHGHHIARHDAYRAARAERWVGGMPPACALPARAAHDPTPAHRAAPVSRPLATCRHGLHARRKHVGAAHHRLASLAADNHLSALCSGVCAGRREAAAAAGGLACAVGEDGCMCCTVHLRPAPTATHPSCCSRFHAGLCQAG